MADSDISSAIKSLQAQIQTLNSNIHSVENRLANDLTMTVEVPKFDGTDPHSWLFRIEEFFRFHSTPEPLRLTIISFYMDGPAATWFHAMKANNLFSTWPKFLASVKLRFDPSIYDDHQGALSKLTQTGSVAEFQSSFERLMNRVSGISESLLVSFFVSGLKPDIKREMSHPRPKPDTLMEAFALARAYEARYGEPKLESELPIRRLTVAELAEKMMMIEEQNEDAR